MGFFYTAFTERLNVVASTYSKVVDSLVQSLNIYRAMEYALLARRSERACTW